MMTAHAFTKQRSAIAKALATTTRMEMTFATKKKFQVAQTKQHSITMHQLQMKTARA